MIVFDNEMEGVNTKLKLWWDIIEKIQVGQVENRIYELYV